MYDPFLIIRVLYQYILVAFSEHELNKFQIIYAKFRIAEALQTDLNIPF